MLAQKPLAEDLAAARAVVEEADRAGLTLAVNQNGRWAPPWRIATLLVRAGRDRRRHRSHTCYDRGLRVRRSSSPHFDDNQSTCRSTTTCVHWVDISRCWLDGKAPESVRALEYRSPGQPPEAKQPWGAWIDIHYADGSSATVRSVGGSRTHAPDARSGFTGARGRSGAAFSSARTSSSWSATARRKRFDLVGAWYVDGFAGAIGRAHVRRRRGPRAVQLRDGTTCSRSS